MNLKNIMKEAKIVPTVWFQRWDRLTYSDENQNNGCFLWGVTQKGP